MGLLLVLVSIPYRDDKNHSAVRMLLLKVEVSIPYRDDKNENFHFFSSNFTM